MTPERFVPAFAHPAGSPIRELFPYLNKPGMISFAGGYPSPSLFDAEGLQQAVGRALALGGSALQYGPTEGSPALKGELLELCNGRAIRCQPEELLITTGSQQAFDLLVRIFIQPGDAVLVEAPAYPAALQALRLAGAAIHEVPMDSQGLQTHRLEEMLRAMSGSATPKFLYTVPTFSNPRGTLLPQSRRQELVTLASRYGLLVVEDDPYGELSFTDEELPQPLYVHGERLAGPDNPVIYLSSLSKTVAPALRVGWMVAAPDIVRRCAIAKQTVDLCTSPVAQLIAAEYLRSGRYPQTVRAARREYSLRVEAMAGSLKRELGDRLGFQRPKGGMFLWAESLLPVDATRLFEAAVEQGVLFVPSPAFYSAQPSRHWAMRLSFAAPTVDQIREGVMRLANAFASSQAVLPQQPPYPQEVSP